MHFGVVFPISCCYAADGYILFVFLTINSSVARETRGGGEGGRSPPNDKLFGVWNSTNLRILCMFVFAKKRRSSTFIPGLQRMVRCYQFCKNLWQPTGPLSSLASLALLPSPPKEMTLATPMTINSLCTKILEESLDIFLRELLIECSTSNERIKKEI